MYLPNHYSTNDIEKVKKLIERNSLATVLSFPQNDRPFINHLPIIFNSKIGEQEILIGHMAKANPQWKHFKTNFNA